jgi:rod shape-determining protein MreC
MIVVETATSYLVPVRSALATVLAPVVLTAESPYMLGGEISDVAVTHATLVERNAELETRMLELSRLAQQYEALFAENGRLRELLGSRARLPQDVRIAEIVGVVPTPTTLQVVLDKGENDGVTVGQAVIDAQGLFGQVVELTSYNSRVLLVADKDHAVPVEVNRNGVRSVLGGTGRIDRLVLEFVPVTADIVKGDLLVTSGLGGRFPRGYPVGVVDSVVVDNNSNFAEIFVRPSAALDRSRHVLVVLDVHEDLQPVPTDVAAADAAAGSDVQTQAETDAQAQPQAQSGVQTPGEEPAP